MEDSLLTPIGYQNSSCGYCKNKSGSFSYCALGPSLTPEFYQTLISRGWRRSGTFLYKPDLRASCCPQYTIRLDSGLFKPSKDQRQVQNRFNTHILGDLYTKEAARRYPKSRDQAKKRKTDFDLLERVHESEKEQLKTPPEPAHTLTVTLESDDSTEEKYAVFENYQRLVHHEPPHKISQRGFKSFLCSSPLLKRKETVNGYERRIGSYHQCYRIDGKLVAVGVLDLLPQCVSGVYFMYHESVHQHNFGKLGALREIALAKEGGYRWWYAGYYIHSCVKMRYKGDYSPQFMLDPESYEWDLLDGDVKKKLDANKYLSLSRERTSALGEAPESPSMDVGSESTKMSQDSAHDVEDNSDDDDPPVPDPDEPLFSRSMPGVLTKDQFLSTVDLAHIKIRVGEIDAEVCDFRTWDANNIELQLEPGSSTLACAELAAAVGPELATEMIIYFGM